MSLSILEVKVCIKMEFSNIYGSHFVFWLLKKFLKRAKLLGQLRDVKSTKNFIIAVQERFITRGFVILILVKLNDIII